MTCNLIKFGIFLLTCILFWYIIDSIYVDSFQRLSFGYLWQLINLFFILFHFECLELRILLLKYERGTQLSYVFSSKNHCTHISCSLTRSSWTSSQARARSLLPPWSGSASTISQMHVLLLVVVRAFADVFHLVIQQFEANAIPLSPDMATDNFVISDSWSHVSTLPGLKRVSVLLRERFDQYNNN